MSTTKIEWATDVWNPVTGCTRVDRGCAHCYAARMAKRLAGRCGYPGGGGFAVTLHPEKLDEPLRWRKPRLVFVDSMGDLFHRDVPDAFVGAVFGVMAAAPRHVFIVLTKRPERVAGWCASLGSPSMYESPLPNVIIGASAHDGDSFRRRAAVLRTVPAACRVMSLEPLVGPVGRLDLDGIGWVIVGGESGPGAAPMHPQWARDVRDQCAAAGVPFLFKQAGEFAFGRRSVSHDSAAYAGRMVAWTVAASTDRKEEGATRWVAYDAGGQATVMERIGKARAGRDLDGVTHDGYPDVALRVRPAGA